MKKTILLIFAAMVMFSCSSLKKTVSVIKQYPSNQFGAIDVVGQNQLKETDILIGSVSVLDNGFVPKKKCTYEIVLQEVLNLARNMGGTKVVIREHREPYNNSSVGMGISPTGGITPVVSSTGSTCHQIKADVYRTETDK